MKLTGLQNEIRDVIISGDSIRPFASRVIPQFFQYKYQLLSLTLTKQNLDLAALCDQSLSHIETDKRYSRLEVLFENILFANRCHQRVVNSIATNPITYKTSFLDALENHSYGSFTAWARSELKEDNALYLLDLINGFLLMDFVILATRMIQEENLPVADAIIRELEFLIADGAQQYLAAAKMVGHVKETNYSQLLDEIEFDQRYLDEQKYLADSGLTDFANQIE